MSSPQLGQGPSLICEDLIISAFTQSRLLIARLFLSFALMVGFLFSPSRAKEAKTAAWGFG
ncbi:hypothetical protein VMCG_02594 [Cytospora schulzeri]|uniref:Uncharacterized protein n=1 Tax=Cytospora schulzeri TaxID=448051 RepID=A0A423X192_9PEZI|nr:hypothetical protein VMCG_02594 [Valsa malicola]